MKKNKFLLIEHLGIEEWRECIGEEVKRAIEERFGPNNIKKGPAENLYTIDETSKLFKVSNRTLFNWVRNKWIPSVTIGRRVYFRAQAVEELIKKNEN